eukprot:EC824952.1.p1 GENE.EC824952.1~~EC824952.1.p1  ORF type:complete len:96 (+),score=40.62 EC824952.1:57-344(+)
MIKELLIQLTMIQLQAGLQRENEVFKGKTLSQIQKMLGVFLVEKSNSNTKKIQIARGFLPTHFDSREQWPSCVHAVRDQGQCGSCWAFARFRSII